MARFGCSFECGQEMILSVAKVYGMQNDSHNLLSDTSLFRRYRAYKATVSDEVKSAVAEGDYFLLGIDGKTVDHKDKECVFVRIIKNNGTSIKLNLFSLAVLKFEEKVNGINLSRAVNDLVNFLGSAMLEKYPHHNFRWSNIFALSADTTSLKVLLGLFCFVNFSLSAFVKIIE